MDIQKLEEQFIRINHLIDDMHNDCLKIDGIPSLTTAEIHLIECIGKHRDANVSELAKLLGHTKGAVSQMALKLEKKSLIEKTRKSNNDKEVVLSLTKAGEKAFNAHEKLHKYLYRELEAVLDEKGYTYTKELMDILEKYLKVYKEEYH